MQRRLWITLLLILAMFVDSTQCGRRKCKCPDARSGDCRIPPGCRCPLVRALCRSKPKSTLVGKRNAGEVSNLDFLTFNRHLQEAEELLELQNKNLYSSPGLRSRLRRWKTND
ncbi:uncharacterized protein [Antedon mediterranea]|uniref:uncharacterized protein n=1 Tax=Antedon mediterranea TaxID=105859 RepID=UPI003AF95172